MSPKNSPLDPREIENWLDLSKQYSHLASYTENGESANTTAATISDDLFPKEKQEWLRESDGLITLHNIWLAAFEKFHKHENLNYITPGGWKKCITIARIKSKHTSTAEATLELNTDKFPDYFKHLFDIGDISEADKKKKQDYERDPMNYRVALNGIDSIEITIHIAIRSKDIAEEWKKLKTEHNKLLESCIWTALVNSFPELRIEDPQSQYNDFNLSDAVDYFSINVKRVSSPAELRSLINIDFNELHQILHPRPSANARPGDEALNRPYIFLGRNTSPIEKTLATFLRSSGFLVILEPELFLPNPEASTYRNPDLLVIDKGRSIFVEIDDTSHLVDHDNEGKPNNKKWKRDRLLYRELLCAGIPVLRVWHQEARDAPERILGQILQVLDSLGGSRLRYE